MNDELHLIITLRFLCENQWCTLCVFLIMQVILRTGVELESKGLLLIGFPMPGYCLPFYITTIYYLIIMAIYFQLPMQSCLGRLQSVFLLKWNQESKLAFRIECRVSSYFSHFKESLSSCWKDFVWSNYTWEWACQLQINSDQNAFLLTLGVSDILTRTWVSTSI